MQNGFCESFNGRMRDELLNESLFRGLDHARAKIGIWIDNYNQRWPHSALGYLTPAAYVANLSATCDRSIGCATPTSFADRTLLHPPTA